MESANTFLLPVPKSIARRAQTDYLINYPTLLVLFLFGSVAGFVIEGICHICKAGTWESHSAVVWGPFCIIYGIGLLAVYLLSSWMSGRNLIQQFIAFTLSGAIIEYAASLFQEICFGSVSWDYSDHFMNIGGRVSLQMALFWGVLGILFVTLILPLLNGVLHWMQGKLLNMACVFLSIFMAVNLIVTIAALFRWQQRQHDSPTVTAIERILDTYFDDSVMSKLYPNMRFQ